ncbi:zinc dependent phospholipase C family protein [Flexistipes sp.]|uniref:zinc dependent phospholipase C family protein n=1 Tax=Flexistipes sp. TaxID=3088135 RepID=UPI002E204FBE|nr:zinc dependent phospholipase C family protein [Flexistipes sp.]
MLKILLSLVFLFAFVDSGFCWGFNTHIKIGLDILETTNFYIIKNYPIHFLLGNIFPDFFNLFKDISQFKKNLKTHSWSTVSKLFNNAETDDEKAFCHGYAGHLSADVIAHNYLVPQNYLLYSRKKVLSHFLVESAEDSYNDKKLKHTLTYLLDNSVFYGDHFLTTMSVDKNYFSREMNILKRSIKYMSIFKLSELSKFIRAKQIPDFKERCVQYQEKAKDYAQASVENGFTQFTRYDPSGSRAMKQAKDNRKKLVKDLGRKQLKSFDKKTTFKKNYLINDND